MAIQVFLLIAYQPTICEAKDGSFFYCHQIQTYVNFAIDQ